MSKKEKDPRDLDVRPYPNPIFQNYDYGGSLEGDETSPGRGLYNGKMDQFDSVKEFIEYKRKRQQKRQAMLTQILHEKR